MDKRNAIGQARMRQFCNGDPMHHDDRILNSAPVLNDFRFFTVSLTASDSSYDRLLLLIADLLPYKL